MPVESREKLLEEFKSNKDKFSGENVPFPENWGGYYVIIEEITFFLYGESRLNDRFAFKLNRNKNWDFLRLYP